MALDFDRALLNGLGNSIRSVSSKYELLKNYYGLIIDV